MTTFQEIAKKMKQQGMTDKQIAKWGNLSETYSHTPKPIVSENPSVQETITKKTTKKRSNMPSKYSIAKYWLEEQMPESIENCSSFQRKLASQDWGEPSCWACGIWKDDCDITDMNHKDPLKCYNKIKWLEICHIIPHSLGGSSNVDNLVLLCKDCHKQAPNVRNPKYMKDFIAHKKSFMYKSIEIIRASEITEKDWLLFLANQESFQDYMNNNLANHFGQKTHFQDLIYTFIDFIDSLKKT